MKELFVPYNLALELKNLGFNEKCLATIDQIEYVHINSTKQPIRGAMTYDTIKAPLYEQVLDWFEKQHGLYSIIRIGYGDPKWYDYLIQNGRESWSEEEISYNTSREVRIACIEKLIEIAKNS